MWKIQATLNLADLGNDFFVAKFSNSDDYDFPLLRGPGMVADHYLMVRQWHPNFDPWEASIDKVAIWTRLPYLPMEYYNDGVLRRIGDRIGKTLKLPFGKEATS